MIVMKAALQRVLNLPRRTLHPGVCLDNGQQQRPGASPSLRRGLYSLYAVIAVAHAAHHTLENIVGEIEPTVAHSVEYRWTLC